MFYPAGTVISGGTAGQEEPEQHAAGATESRRSPVP